jgi:hypothetical protein
MNTKTLLMFAAVAAVLGTVSVIAMQPAFASFSIDGSNVNTNSNTQGGSQEGSAFAFQNNQNNQQNNLQRSGGAFSVVGDANSGNTNTQSQSNTFGSEDD